MTPEPVDYYRHARRIRRRLRWTQASLAALVVVLVWSAVAARPMWVIAWDAAAVLVYVVLVVLTARNLNLAVTWAELQRVVDRLSEDQWET